MRVTRWSVLRRFYRMITTTLAVLALAGGLSTGSIPSPSWHKDYAQAMALASSEHKPMAVFISRGSAMPGKMLADGTIPTEAAKLLRESYVCVYLDTETAAGKELAGRFALPEGLVISGPGGSVQALRHNGSVSGIDLTGNLTRYATAGAPATTATSGATPVVYSGGYTNSNSGVPYAQAGYTSSSQPVYQAAPTYQAAPAYQVTPLYPQTYPAYYTNPFGSCVGQR
jgi:hypothetical protein